MRILTGSDVDLRWVQPHRMVRFFELRSGDDVLATLSWEKTSGTLAMATAADESWTFKRVGLFHAMVTVRSTGSNADIAVFKPGWGYGGTLEIQGRAYTWKKLDFWGNRWGFTRHDGTTLLSFTYTGGLDSLLKLEGSAAVSPGASTDRDLPLLVTLGWYIMVLMRDDNTTVIAAVTAAR